MGAKSCVAAAAVWSAMSAGPAAAGPEPVLLVRPTAAVAVVPDLAGEPVEGLTCGLLSVTDPLGPDDAQTGVLFGGPLADDTGTAIFTMTCTIQVGGSKWHHAAVDDLAVTSAPGTAVLVPPTTVTYARPPGDSVHVCTQVDSFGGVSRYWNAAGREWSPHPHVPCALAAHVEVLPGPLFDLVHALVTGVVDPAACPVLARAFPPEGDVPGIWDCPPYT